MEVSPETAIRTGAKLSWGQSLLGVIFGLMLAGFGIVFITVGHNAIERRSYDMEWKESRGTFLSVGGIEDESSHGVKHFGGVSAVRVGAGFVLSGALFGLWGAMIIWSMFHPLRPASGNLNKPRGIGRMLGLVSFAMLLAAQGCFFPVWQTQGLVFWSVVVGMPVIIELLIWSGKTRWTGILFIVLIVLAILIPAPSISLALAMGIFGTMFCLAHLVFLFPNLFGAD